MLTHAVGLRAATGVAVAGVFVLGASPAGGASVAVSSSSAGARPVALTVTIGTDLRCGRLNGPSVAVRLPAAARVPRTVPRSAVLVGGAAAGRVSVVGHTVTAYLPTGRPVCNTIAPGVVHVVITRAANIGNPPAPGRYAVVVTVGGEQWAPAFTVR